MKILLLIDSLKVGGAERVATNLANNWSKSFKEVILVTFESDKYDCYDLNKSVIRLSIDNSKNISIPFFKFISVNLRRYLKIKQIIKEYDPDILIGMMSVASSILGMLKKSFPKKIFIGSERTYPPLFPLGFLKESIRKYTYKNLDYVVMQTEKGKIWAEKFLNCNKVKVIPNPVKYPLSSIEDHILPNMFKNKNILLSVGRLAKEKQFDHLIEIFSEISDNYPDWVLVIVGDGPEKQHLKEAINFYKLNDKVILHGHEKNIASWYKISKLFVLCSKFEGFPNCLIEAMSYGNAVISYDCDTGPRDIIENYQNGILVEVNNRKLMKEAIVNLMSDDELRNSIASKAIMVRESFSENRVANMWEDLFE
jgi:glycosyltransferase involved in cell wall biosynthesis